MTVYLLMIGYMKRRQWNPYKIMFSLYRRFVPNKQKAILFMVLQFCSRMVMLFSPYLFWKILNTIQLWWEQMVANLLWYMWLLALLPLIDWLFHGPSRVREEQLSFDTTKAYQMYLYHCITSLPLERHTNNHSWDTIDKINKAKSALSNFSWNIYTALGTFVSFTGAMVALMVIRPLLWLCLIVLWWLMLWLIIRFDKKIVIWIKEENLLSNKVWWLMVDYLTNIKTLIALRFIESTHDNLSQWIQSMYVPFNKHTTRNEWKWFTTDSLLKISLVLITWLYMYHSISTTGVIIIGTITMIYQYTERVSQTFYNLARQYSQMVRNVANTQSVDPIIDAYNSLPSSSNLSWLWDWDQIEVRNLTFHYKDKKDILSDVSFGMKRGEKIAFVWESGSGKSTLLSLLRGLYDVEKVHVEIDGKQYNTLAPLYNDTSLIPQEPEIFEESIAFNITMWSAVSQEVMEQYSRMARFHDIAVWLPHGYDTNIKEKGVNLSGWQKQRLALARGLLVAEESSIVLLDESTSSVDSINEKKIYTNIFHHFHDKTIIAAVHKLHLLTMFDTIYVFDAWKVIESGSFHDLIAQWGMLAKMREEYQASQKKK